MIEVISVDKEKLRGLLFSIAEDLYRALDDIEGDLDEEVVEELDIAIEKTIQELIWKENG